MSLQAASTVDDADWELLLHGAPTPPPAAPPAPRPRRDRTGGSQGPRSAAVPAPAPAPAQDPPRSSPAPAVTTVAGPGGELTPVAAAVAQVTRTMGDRVCDWIEKHCRIPEGQYVARPVKLSPFQREVIKGIYDTPTRRVIISFGRKNAKTTLAAFLLLVHLVGPMAVRNSQLYSTAQSREQAAILFSLASKVVRLSPTLQHHILIRDASKQLYCEELGTLYKALSAEASTAYGLSPVFTVHDELGQVRGPRSELYTALETASAAQHRPLSIIISTQAPNDADLLSQLIDTFRDQPDPMQKLFLYAADLNDDPFSEEAIRKANPAFEDFMNREEVLQMAADARRMPALEAQFRNYILNQRVAASSPFVTRTVWENNGAAAKLPKGTAVYMGLDLSSVSDLTALVMAGWVDGKLAVVPTFWLPGDGLVTRAHTDRVPYDLWAQQGHLITPAGAAIQYEYVARHLRTVFNEYDVRVVGFDRYNMRFLRPWLVKAGFTTPELDRFSEFGQGYVSMSPALRELETLLLTSQIRHGNHPVLSMCAANAVVVQDEAGNRKFAKNKGTGRIDGMVALTMAVGVMPNDTGKSRFKVFFA